MKKWLLSAVLATACSSALALRCGGNLVSIDDSPAEVRAACGEPSARYHQDVVHKAKQTYQEIERYQALDVWVYRTGSNTLLQILVFQDDALKNIENGDYGSHYTADHRQCEGPAFGVQVGDWAPEIELRCGPPDDKRLLERRDQPYATGQSGWLLKQVQVELWRYHFPQSGHSAELKLENGQLKWLNWVQD